MPTATGFSASPRLHFGTVYVRRSAPCAPPGGTHAGATGGCQETGPDARADERGVARFSAVLCRALKGAPRNAQLVAPKRHNLLFSVYFSGTSPPVPARWARPDPALDAMQITSYCALQQFVALHNAARETSRHQIAGAPGAYVERRIERAPPIGYPPS